jgi:RHS repeat-associated protein
MNFTKKSLLKFTSLAFGLIAATNVSAVTITYIHNDAAGTPLVATDASGNLLWKENYRPYGDRLNNQPASSNNSLWYSGKPYDSQTGLTYMGARYYDTVLGRFTGVDPHGFDPDNIQSFNRYAYANNNPYKFVDPNGKYAVWALEVDYTLFFGIASRVGGAALGVAIGSLGFDILHPHAFEPLQSRGGFASTSTYRSWAGTPRRPRSQALLR